MDATQQSQLETDGWCVLPDVLPPDKTETALDHLWMIVEQNRRAGIRLSYPEVDPNDRNIRVLNLLAEDALFRDLVNHDDALEAVYRTIGPRFILSNFTANIARPGSGSMPVHSDLSFVAPEPWNQPWSVNVIWCLTDTYAENGATRFVPGSHRWTDRKCVPVDVDSHMRTFEAKAGSAVIMDGRLWHTSGENRTSRVDRALLFAYYSVPFLRAQTNWNVALPLTVQLSLSPEMRQWLGLELNANLDFVFDLSDTNE